MVKKKLSPCQECQRTLAANREVLEACHKERGRLRTELESAQADRTALTLDVVRFEGELGDAKAELMKKNQRVEELERALAELAPLTEDLRQQVSRLRERWGKPAAEKRLAQDVELYQRLQGGDAPWLVKDFNVLYRCALAFSEACSGQGDGKPYAHHQALKAQLERLKPAFDITEGERTG